MSTTGVIGQQVIFNGKKQTITGRKHTSGSAGDFFTVTMVDRDGNVESVELMADFAALEAVQS